MKMIWLGFREDQVRKPDLVKETLKNIFIEITGNCYIKEEDDLK